jgi:hypothetical protein
LLAALVKTPLRVCLELREKTFDPKREKFPAPEVSRLRELLTERFQRHEIMSERGSCSLVPFSVIAGTAEPRKPKVMFEARRGEEEEKASRKKVTEKS